MDFVFRIGTKDAHDIAQVHFVHADNIVKFRIIFFSHLAGLLEGNFLFGNSMLEKLAAGSVMDRVADFFCAGGRGFDVEIVGDAFGADHVS